MENLRGKVKNISVKREKCATGAEIIAKRVH
jgi:hypothetical protein